MVGRAQWSVGASVIETDFLSLWWGQKVPEMVVKLTTMFVTCSTPKTDLKIGLDGNIFLRPWTIFPTPKIAIRQSVGASILPSSAVQTDFQIACWEPEA